MQNFPFVSIKDIFEAKDDDEKMKKILGGKIVFIGSTTFGAHDFRHTPVDPKLPGVYFHMNLVHMLSEGYFYKPKEDSLFYSWVFLIAGLAVIILVLIYNNAIIDIFVLGITLGVSFYLDQKYFIPDGYQLKLFFIQNAYVATYSFHAISVVSVYESI